MEANRRAKSGGKTVILVTLVLAYGLVVCCSADVVAGAIGGTIYVDGDANGADNGSSWEDAFNYLQDALSATRRAPNIEEIWVAEGIYRPDGDSNHPGGTGDRRATFELINGVTIKGGFAGYGEPEPDARDPNVYETILGGDLAGDDIEINDPRELPKDFNRIENSCHVVDSSYTGANAVLDGFTIRGGNATCGPDYYGGGIYCYEGSPTINNCVLKYNYSRHSGGGISMESDPAHPACSATITNCLFTCNTSGYAYGLAMFCFNASPTISSCTFYNNKSDRPGSRGGGIFCMVSSAPFVTNCMFYDNDSWFGGAICAEGWHGPVSPSLPTMINCVFANNKAACGGGLCSWDSNATVINCGFYGNSAEAIGGGIRTGGSFPTIVTNCIIWGNKDSYVPGPPEEWLMDESAQIHDDSNSSVNVTYSCIEGLGELYGPGTGNIGDDPCFVELGYWDANSTPNDVNDDFWVDSDYHLGEDSPCIDAGDPNYAVGPNETDLDGNPRVVGGRIDMGAYEYSNTSPVACIVGGDRVVEVGEDCAGRVVLDGSCSSDADSTEGTNDDINDFDWYEVIDVSDPNSDIYIGSGEVIECNLGLGEHLIVLEVTDKAGAFDSNEVVITVEDVTPPELSVVVEPDVLWPPNGKMVLVRPEWQVSDNCDEGVEVSLVDISMNVEGDINDYVRIGDDGSIYLRAVKSKRGSERIYTLTYQAMDDSGNVAAASATVTVPHSRKVWRLDRGLVRQPGKQVYRKTLQRR